jgi:hypothetical protein
MKKSVSRPYSFRVIERSDGTDRWDVRLFADGEDKLISVHNLKQDAAYVAARCRDCAKTLEPNFFKRPLLNWFDSFLYRLNYGLSHLDDSETSNLQASTFNPCSFKVVQRSDGTNRWDVRLITDDAETVISVHNLMEDAVYGVSRCQDCMKTFDPNFFNRPLLSWYKKFVLRLNRDFDYPDDDKVFDFRVLQ